MENIFRNVLDYKIDLRSDTVTKPTQEMYNAMFSAEIGDDVYEEDKSVQELQDTLAEYFGKEKGLFFPTGTMCNLCALLCWNDKRGSEIIVGDKSHIFLFEQGGAAQFGGISMRTIHNESDGTLDIESIKRAIRDDDIHEPSTSLICIENTHNVCGGKILKESYLHELRLLSNEQKLPIHLDGARIWNALQESEMNGVQMGSFVDSLSVCLSKGLGAPVGSVLLGTSDFIQRAKRIRKALGGGMRQSGVLANAGLVGFRDFQKGILKQDHSFTQIIADEFKKKEGFIIQDVVETNILFVHIQHETHNEKSVTEFFRQHNILISSWDTNLIRIVLHRNITADDIEYFIQSIQIL
jgi:threonine aldolase